MVVGDPVCAPCSIANSLEALFKVRGSVSSHRQAEEDNRAYNPRYVSTCYISSLISCLLEYSPWIHFEINGIRINQGAPVGARLVF